MMDSATQRAVSTVLSVVGILLFIAPSFSLIPRNLGSFLGIAAFLIAGVLYGLPKKS